MEDPDQDNLEHDALLEKAIRLAAAMPTMLAMYQRLRTDKEPVEPDAKLSMAANFLYMVNGEKPTETQSKAFDLYLVLLAEHSMNASTFTARSTVSGALSNSHRWFQTMSGGSAGSRSTRCASKRRRSCQNRQVKSGQIVVLLPSASMYQLEQPPAFQTVPCRSAWIRSFQACCSSRRGSTEAITSSACWYAELVVWASASVMATE